MGTEQLRGEGDEATTVDPGPTPDPLALDPMGPIASEPHPGEVLAGPLALDPLSPIGRSVR
jgi:hypothetical protein